MHRNSQPAGSGCPFPSPVEDEDLLAYLEERASPDIQAHLAQCPACNQRLAAFEKVYTGLMQDRKQPFHPGPQLLGDYHLSFLEPGEALLVALHLKRCSSCAQEMAHLLAFLKDDQRPAAAQTANGESFQVVVARLLHHILPQQTALAGLRTGGSSTQAYTWIYQAGQSEVSLRARVAAGIPQRFHLLGEVDGPLTLQRVSLWPVGAVAPVSQIDLDDAGQFSLVSVAPGAYDLVFDGPGGLLRIPNLLLGQVT